MEEMLTPTAAHHVRAVVQDWIKLGPANEKETGLSIRLHSRATAPSNSGGQPKKYTQTTSISGGIYPLRHLIISWQHQASESMDTLSKDIYNDNDLVIIYFYTNLSVCVHLDQLKYLFCF